jgi:hypothetical protein
MRTATTALLLLLALAWATPALALDWWVQDEAQAQALEVALTQLWPGHGVVIRQGSPPTTEDAVWVEQGAIVLRHEGTTRRAEQVSAASTQVVLVRSWLEAGLALPPPPPPPPPRVSPGSWAPSQLHAPHLLPGAGGSGGAELSVGAVGTGSLDTDPIEGAARGYAPVVAAAVAVGRIRANATAWNLWEPERSHRPMGVAGVSILVADNDRWRMAPWLGAAGGWKQTEGEPGEQVGSAYASAAGAGPGGVVGTGVSLEVSTDRLTWDLSLPIAGWMTWQVTEDPDSPLDYATGRAGRLALLLPYPEAGISWAASGRDTLRFGLLASVPSLRWRHDADHAFFELSAATSVGLGRLGDGDLLLGGAVQGQLGVRL